MLVERRKGPRGPLKGKRAVRPRKCGSALHERDALSSRSLALQRALRRANCPSSEWDRVIHRLCGRAHAGRSRPARRSSRRRPGAAWRPKRKIIVPGPALPRGEDGCRLALLVPLAWNTRGACGCGLSTTCSPWGLPKENSSRRRLPLDAFSGYPFRAWLTGRAVGRQPGHPEAPSAPVLSY